MKKADEWEGFSDLIDIHETKLNKNSDNKRAVFDDSCETDGESWVGFDDLCEWDVEGTDETSNTNKEKVT